MSSHLLKAMFAAALLALANCALRENSATARRVTPAWIEENYAKQLARLEELASYGAERRGGRIGAMAKSDAKLFSAPEILEARLRTGRRSSSMIGGKRIDHKRVINFTIRWRLPAVTKLLYVLMDGKRLNAWEYRDKVIDKDGRRVEIILILDADKLRDVKDNKQSKQEQASEASTATPK